MGISSEGQLREVKGGTGRGLMGKEVQMFWGLGPEQLALGCSIDWMGKTGEAGTGLRRELCDTQDPKRRGQVGWDP